MQNVVLLPGIFGTRMIGGDGFELWPPLGQTVPMDVQTRATRLIDPTTKAGALLEGIALLPGVDIPEYSPITQFLENLPATQLVRFGYDWRVDIRQTADVLAQSLAELGEGPIVLVAHSMGGLVARFMLECGKFDGQPWFGRIKQLVCIATPHFGAPLTLFRLLGFEGFANFVFPGPAMALLGSRPDLFPAGHQLLPPPTIGCVQTSTAANSDVGTAFPGIDRGGLAAGTALYATLGRFRRPPAVRYQFIFGFGNVNGRGPGTTVGITVDDRGRTAHVFGEGDGTVPFWSALPSTGPAGFIADHFGAQADHVGLLADQSVLQRLEDWISPRMV